MLSRPALSALALVLTSSLLLSLPAPGHAAVAVQVTPAGELRADDYTGEGDQIEIRFEPASQTVATARFLVEDSVGAAPYNPTCVVVTPTITACDAAAVRSIGVGLAAGDDVLVVSAEGAAPVPSRYSARIKGGSGSDVIRGGSGDDSILGEDGGDIVAGWLGDDDLSGGKGDDGLIGFEGDDRLTGGPGRDALFGQAGRDTLIGGVGNDVLLARDKRRDRRIDCGAGGLERAITDRVDPPALSCPPPPKKKKAAKAPAKAVGNSF